MNYKNAKTVLPEKLLTEIQKYIEGDLLYIPHSHKRKAWGENSGTKEELRGRNTAIVRLRREGKSLTELAQTYCLSEDTVRKIISASR